MKPWILLSVLTVACGGSDFAGPFGGAAGQAGSVTAGAAGSAGAPDAGDAGAGGSAGQPDGAAGAAGTDAGACWTIEVTSAVYAANCGAATPMPTIAEQCNGEKSCDYVVDTANKDPKGDPAPGCWKDLTVLYTCAGDGEPVKKSSYTTMVHDNTVVSLDCCPP